MATTATPNGAEPVGTLSSSGSFTGKVRHIKIANAYAFMCWCNKYLSYKK